MPGTIGEDRERHRERKTEREREGTWEGEETILGAMACGT